MPFVFDPSKLCLNQLCKACSLCFNPVLSIGSILSPHIFVSNLIVCSLLNFLAVRLWVFFPLPLLSTSPSSFTLSFAIFLSTKCRLENRYYEQLETWIKYNIVKHIHEFTHTCIDTHVHTDMKPPGTRNKEELKASVMQLWVESRRREILVSVTYYLWF